MTIATKVAGKSSDKRRSSSMKSVIVTPTGIKLGSRGKVQHVSEFFGMVTKGEARKLRKGLREAGFPNLAGMRRIVTNYLTAE